MRSRLTPGSCLHVALAGALGTLALLPPAPAAGQLRNVDPATGRPVVGCADPLPDPWNSLDDVPAQSFADLDGRTLGDLRLLGFQARSVGPARRALRLQPSSNAEIFATLCRASASLSANGDLDLCAWTADASGGLPPNPATPPPSLAEALSAILAGEPSSAVAGPFGLLALLQTNQKAYAEVPAPLRATNRDLRDGEPSDADSVDDFLSLDSVLTAGQRALLGCGPFYGTRCDTFASDPSVLFGEDGGVDLREAELGALALALPATFAGSLAWRTTRLDAAQPGTLGFDADPACRRYVPGDRLADDAGWVRLPGCRGIAAFGTPDPGSLPAGAPIEFLFERGYAPEVDGCVLGVSEPGDATSRGLAIAGHPVVARRLRPRDDPAFDPGDPSGSAEDITALLDGRCGGAGAEGEASTTRIGAPAYAGDSLFRRFAQTAWHPLAGCRSATDALAPSDAVRRCDFTARSFEQEFLEGRAQLFRSEMAAVSWNLLVLLVVTSCDAARGGDDLRDPECFDPRPAGVDENGEPVGNAAWAPDRCSLAAPQFCRNVRPLLEAARDEDRDGIPDLAEADALCQDASASRAVLGPAHGGLVSVAIERGPRLAGAELRVTGVTQDEPLATWWRRGRPDALLFGQRVFLRATRSASGNGRVYRVHFSASRVTPGSCGVVERRCSGSVAVCVPRAKRAGCQDDGQHWDSLAR